MISQFNRLGYDQYFSVLQMRGNQLPVFCHQAAAQVPDRFCNFYLVKNQRIAKNTTTSKARENISTDFQSLEF
jgi:hypothetical protein